MANPNEPADETVVVSRTQPVIQEATVVEEATVYTSPAAVVDEATVFTSGPTEVDEATVFTNPASVVDEATVTSSTGQPVEEATVLNAGKPLIEEATVTGDSHNRFDETVTGPCTPAVAREVDEHTPVPTLRTGAIPIVPEVEPQREVPIAYVAPETIERRSSGLQDELIERVPEITPDVKFVKPPRSGEKDLYKKSMNRNQRNSTAVLVSVIVGALLIGVTAAILWVNFR